jgi:uncharacterized protein involved in propanediol utilization
MCGRSGAGQQPRAFVQGGTEVEACVAFSDGVDFASGGELLDGVLADRLEQLIPTAIAELHEQRFFDEAGGQIRDCAAVWPSIAQTSLAAVRSNGPANTADRPRRVTLRQ